MADWAPLTELAQGIALEFKSADLVGPDLRVLARIPGRDQFMSPHAGMAAPLDGAHGPTLWPTP